jgi:hypothetical protein
MSAYWCLNGRNLFTAVLVAPVVCVMSGLSLTVLQRTLEWIASIAKDPSPKGYFRTLKPYARQLHDVLDRVMGGKPTRQFNDYRIICIYAFLIIYPYSTL